MLTVSTPFNDINLFVRGGAPIAAATERERYVFEENDKVAQALFNKQVPFTVNQPEHKDYMEIIMNNAKSISDIKLPELSLNTESFTADPIKYEKDDNKEIKQLIQKINKKIACHACDHSKFKKLQLVYVKDVIELRNSKNLKTVQNYYNMLADYAIRIRSVDRSKKYIEKHKTFSSVACDDDFLFQNSVELKKAQTAAVDFNLEALAIKTKYCVNHCVHCEKLQKEYKWCVDEIDRLRQERINEREEQIKRIQEEINNPPIIDFMNEYFKDKDRVKLGDIAKMWKAVKGKSIKQDDIADMLEESEAWTTSNSHNIRYANKKKE